MTAPLAAAPAASDTAVSHRVGEVTVTVLGPDAGAWLGAPVGLVRADGSRKPSCAALEGLIKGEWWLPATVLRTDANGRVRVRGFFGEYRVSAAGGSASLAVQAGLPAATARITG
jgi:endo-1,4-beta-xylanase